MHDIQVDQYVIDYILQNGRDYRVSTSCGGPVIVPVEMKSPKESDLKVKVGSNTLYISRVQARYIRRITMDMLDYSRYDSCPVF
ncbi:MAG: hypothetical protein GX369_02920 [Euryarchaeota archaeon]|nr:hypothetical protein [Euryarchaeota archaeon]